MTFDVHMSSSSYTVEVHFRRQKRIIIRKKDTQTLRVSAPHKTSKKALIHMIKTHEKHLTTLPVKPNFEQTLLKPTVLDVFGMRYPVVYQLGKPLVFIDGKTLVVQTNNMQETAIQRLLKQTLKTWLLDAVTEAHQAMKQAFPMLKRFSLTFHTQYMTSRFGSCHAQKERININLALIHYPPIYLKSVLAHELSHLFVQSHQKAFYDVLSRFNPHHKDHKKALDSVHRRYIRDITNGL